MELSQKMKNRFKNVFVLWSKEYEVRNLAAEESREFIYDLLKEAGPVKFPESEEKFEVSYWPSYEDSSRSVGVIKELYVGEPDDEDVKCVLRRHNRTDTVMVKFVGGDEVELLSIDDFRLGDLVYQVRDILNLDVRVLG